MLALFIRSGRRNHESDEELISKYRHSGDKAYIGELFQRYTHLIFGVCMKYLKNEADSQDAVMDIFEKIMTDLKRHEVEHFKAWLFFVSKNFCLMKLRKDKTVRTRKGGYQIFVKEIMEFDDELHLKDEGYQGNLENDLKKGIEFLKDEQKECIELYYFEEKSYDEIAELTGFSFKQVKSFLQNGKRNLKIYLKFRYEQ